MSGLHANYSIKLDGERKIVGFDQAGPSEITRLLIARDAAGQKKYGATLDRRDLSHADWLQHMAEELLDAAGYALAAKREALAEAQQQRPAIQQPPLSDIMQALEGREGWHSLTAQVQRKGDTLLLGGLCVLPAQQGGGEVVGAGVWTDHEVHGDTLRCAIKELRRSGLGVLAGQLELARDFYTARPSAPVVDDDDAEPTPEDVAFGRGYALGRVDAEREALAQQPAAEYADADALIAHLDRLCDESDEKWQPAQAAIAGILSWQTTGSPIAAPVQQPSAEAVDALHKRADEIELAIARGRMDAAQALMRQLLPKRTATQHQEPQQ